MQGGILKNKDQPISDVLDTSKSFVVILGINIDIYTLSQRPLIRDKLSTQP